MRDNDILATLYIYTVTVLAVPRITNREVAQNKVLATHGVKVPCRTVLKSNAFQQNVLAVHEMEHYRAEERFDYQP